MQVTCNYCPKPPLLPKMDHAWPCVWLTVRNPATRRWLHVLLLGNAEASVHEDPQKKLLFNLRVRKRSAERNWCAFVSYGQ